ncbi:type IX secretion system protein PorG [Flavobacterium restrictum]|uniref:DUF6089 domain-containing protein n=1 Tax=Flavobacterium restrictum TaxID=2594428 RepID=A0A553E1X0_9FLAO|nr:DUF6089 family protein [Flavobacterium restrictum]TRX39021.1 hypothetical protein FNW21_10545 [Flavobacterium restrictum]
MTKYFYLFLLFFTAITLQAQIHEIGVFLGGSNYVGDVGSTTYIDPNEPAFGILYKWNKSPRHSYRFSYTQSTLSANDSDSKEGSRKQRGFQFKNSVKELSAGLEFNFFDFNLHDSRNKVTPYVYSGVSYFRYDELYVDLSGQTQKDKSASSFAIPMIVGIKSNITPHFILGIEAGARYTLIDNLDGSNPKNENLKPLQFGNINNNDWYVFTGLTLTYTFGNKPCYCQD